MLDAQRPAQKLTQISLLVTGQFSDIVIRAGEAEFKLHKAVLAPQSTYFAELLSKNAVFSNSSAKKGVCSLIL
jgi:hypothetical protein